MTEQNELHGQNMRLVKKLLYGVVGMFIFAVGILPPLYDVLCDLTGLNGKTAMVAASGDGVTVAEERTLRIQFIANVDPAMPWKFRPQTRSLRVHPGEIHQIDYFAENPTDRLIIGQAIPSVSPARATNHFKKTECFCFNEQELQPGQRIDMPLIFYIDPNLPKNVNTITLSYQLYDITDRVSANRTHQRQAVTAIN